MQVGKYVKQMIQLTNAGNEMGEDGREVFYVMGIGGCASFFFAFAFIFTFIFTLSEEVYERRGK